MSDVPHETVPPKRIDIAEFRELGFLQEANRVFFHPLGLALEVVSEDCPNCDGGVIYTTGTKPGGDGEPPEVPEQEPCETCGGNGTKERLGGVWDYRDDPEGIAYALPLKIDTDKVEHVEREFKKHKEERVKLFGRVIQKPGQELDPQEEYLEQGGED